VKDLSVYFRTRLVEAWDEHSVGSAFIDDDLYVQWSAQPAGLQIECVSNRYLPQERQLTFQQRRRLQKAGWQSPAGEDLPNYWLRFQEREELPAAVAALMDAVDILRLGLPSSEPAQSKTPPEPESNPRQQQHRRSRTMVVVPVYKGGAELSAWAVGTLVSGRLGAVIVVDLLGLDGADLPVGRRVAGLSAADVHDGHDVVVMQRDRELADDLASWLRMSADLISVVQFAAIEQRDVVVLAPYLIDPDPWLYAGVVGELADEVILCVEDDAYGYAERAALRLLEARNCPAPLVLRGEHAEQSDRVAARARAVLKVGFDDRAPSVAAALRALVDDKQTTDPAAAELLVDARSAPLWARLRLLLSRQQSSEPVENVALTLLEDLAELLGSTNDGEFREQVLSVLHAVVERLDFWVRRDSPAAARQLPVIAAKLVECGDDSAWVAKDLRVFYSEKTDARAARPRDSAGRHRHDNGERVEAHMHYIEGGTTCGGKAQFAAVLEEWLNNADREATVGQPSTFAGKPLVWVELDGQRFHLNGDTQDKGVREYLGLVRQHGSELPWHVIANTRGRINKIAFGDPPTALDYFYLYAKDEASAPYTV
jgi:hypothetical protein